MVFAHVYTNGAGTSSNQLGLFTLSFNANIKDTMLTVSCVGYKTNSIGLKKHGEEIIIFLEPKTEMLREVVITALTPTQILKKADRTLIRNFSSSIFSAKFELEQYIFDDDGNSLLGYSYTKGLLNDKLVDSAKVYPKVQIDSISISEGFLRYDTVSNIGFNVIGVAHSLSPYFFFSTLNPVKHFLSKSPYKEDFYESIDITLEGMIEINNEAYYSVSLVSKKSNKKSDIAGNFLINSKDFGIRNVVIKFDSYSPDGAVAGKAHVSASYEKIRNKYFLSNLDILLTKFHNSDFSKTSKLFYFNSLQIAEIKTRKMVTVNKKWVITKDAHYRNFHNTILVHDLQQSFNLSFIKNGNFFKPIRNCSSCALNGSQ